MNSNLAAGTVVAAADARAAITCGSNLAAGTAGTEAAADARVITISRSLQRAATVRLAIDGEAVSCGDIDAFRGGQVTPVRQDQVDIAGDGDAVRYVNFIINHIPIFFITFVSSPLGNTRRHNRCCLCRAIIRYAGLGVIIPCVVDVLCLLRLCLRPRRKGQQAQQDK